MIAEHRPSLFHSACLASAVLATRSLQASAPTEEGLVRRSEGSNGSESEATRIIQRSMGGAPHAEWPNYSVHFKASPLQIKLAGATSIKGHL